ncbi:FAD-dependent monooxygenase [Paraburkholderia agricolaris]|uniref:FAD-dependent monooxygenase n=1 Tax=Paraburkholderia agricolaris TaxID=2152888 RepID=A0ABW9A0K0_9BURK
MTAANEEVMGKAAYEPDFEVEVLIVGTGPTGSTAALALAKEGIRVAVVSQWNWLANSPRAHITNQRAMEVFRDLGVEEELQKYATPWAQMGDMVFATSLCGREIARLRAWGTGEDRNGEYRHNSPCPMADIPQASVEPVLVKNAAERGARFLFNTEYTGHADLGDHVLVHLLDKPSGRTYQVRCQYLVGADGARSRIARDLQLPMEGHSGREGFVYVQFTADLARYVSHRPSMLYWMISSQTSFGEIGMGLLRAVRPWDQWIAGWGFDVSKGQPVLTADVVQKRVRDIIGSSDVPFEVQSVSTWLVNQEYATHYHSGRVFCAGDAVHRHPPSSGLGSNTCVQDAFNLAWKLAYVLKGYAGPMLLNSYTDERAPVGEAIVRKANRSRQEYAALKACFVDQQGTPRVDSSLETLLAPSAEGSALRKRLVEAVDVKNREFNAAGMELNQRYKSSAVIPDENSDSLAWSPDAELHAHRSTEPGSKLPHVWLVDTEGQKVSTLDVVGAGQFTLITGLAGRCWIESVERLKFFWLETAVVNGERYRDVYGNWQKICEVDDGGAVLVRPDGYVAWRHRTLPPTTDEALTSLSTALSTVLSKPAPVAQQPCLEPAQH